VRPSAKDFAQAYQYSITSRNISDSIDNVQQREQLQLIELENEETLRVQQVAMVESETRRRNNIQYTAIAIIIASVFIVLFVLGGIKVHPTFIRMMGFLCFILFFDFQITENQIVVPQWRPSPSHCALILNVSLLRHSKTNLPRI